MELEEMKNVWTVISESIEKQNKLTDKLITMMTQEKYRDNMNKIRIPEIMGSVVCVAIAILILINFDKFETTYLLACGIISAVILVLLPVISLGSIYTLTDLNITKNSYKQILTDYARGKNKFLSLQKLNFYLSYVLLISILPVMVKMMSQGDVQIESHVWYWYLPVGSLFYILFARWVNGHYRKTTLRMENLLKELEA